MTDNILTSVPAGDQARLNITYNEQNGELRETIPYDARDMDIIRMAEEAIRGGDVPGIDADPDASLEGFQVNRYPAHAGVEYNRVVVRPKTTYA